MAIVSVKLPRSKVAVPETVRVALLASLSAAPSSRVPSEALKVVVATAPLRVKVPAPDLEMAPEPAKVAAVMLLAPVRLRVKPALSKEPVSTTAPFVAVMVELTLWVRLRPIVCVALELLRMPFVPIVRALPFSV